jgi:hypothetical protein
VYVLLVKTKNIWRFFKGRKEHCQLQEFQTIVVASEKFIEGLVELEANMLSIVIPQISIFGTKLSLKLLLVIAKMKHNHD